MTCNIFFFFKFYSRIPVSLPPRTVHSYGTRSRGTWVQAPEWARVVGARVRPAGPASHLVAPVGPPCELCGRWRSVPLTMGGKSGNTILIK